MVLGMGPACLNLDTAWLMFWFWQPIQVPSISVFMGQFWVQNFELIYPLKTVSSSRASSVRDVVCAPCARSLFSLAYVAVGFRVGWFGLWGEGLQAGMLFVDLPRGISASDNPVGVMGLQTPDIQQCFSNMSWIAGLMHEQACESPAQTCFCRIELVTL